MEGVVLDRLEPEKEVGVLGEGRSGVKVISLTRGRSLRLDSRDSMKLRTPKAPNRWKSQYRTAEAKSCER